MMIMKYYSEELIEALTNGESAAVVIDKFLAPCEAIPEERNDDDTRKEVAPMSGAADKIIKSMEEGSSVEEAVEKFLRDSDAKVEGTEIPTNEAKVEHGDNASTVSSGMLGLSMEVVTTYSEADDKLTVTVGGKDHEFFDVQPSEAEVESGFAGLREVIAERLMAVMQNYEDSIVSFTRDTLPSMIKPVVVEEPFEPAFVA